MDAERFRRVIERIDALNRRDPTTELVNGIASPRELVYSQRVTEWVLRLDPDASQELRIAARGQHVCRWTIPRDRYERTRRGYLRWREVLKAFHAQKVGELMREVGYPGAAVQRVQAIMSKRQLETDVDTQTLEDALCLVFLETQLTDLQHKTPDDKMREIVRKTWRKMSEQGRHAALQLSLDEEGKRLLTQALSVG